MRISDCSSDVCSSDLSSASMVALGAGRLAAALAGLALPLGRPLARPLARAVMALAIVATLFGSPFVAGLAQQVGLPSADWLPETAQYRLHIWDTASQPLPELPLFGSGPHAPPDLPLRAPHPFPPGPQTLPP